MPGFPVDHYLPELAQTHVHWVSDAIQLSHPLFLFLLLPSVFPSIRVFSNEPALCIRWPKYWSFKFIYSRISYHAAATANSLQSCPTLCDPIDGSTIPPPSLGFSRQEYWSGLPFSSPMHESEKWKLSRSVVSDSERPHGLLHPWDFSGKGTGVGCHWLFHYHLLNFSYPLPDTYPSNILCDLLFLLIVHIFPLK